PRISCEAPAVHGPFSAVRLSIALGVLGATLAGVLGFMGCGSTCEGTMVDGKCETTCRDELCAAGAKCLLKSCRLTCATNADCATGQTCRGGISDYGTKGSFCIGEPKHVAGAEGEPCKTSEQCQTKYGFRCVERAGSEDSGKGGTCTLTCDLHAQ